MHEDHKFRIDINAENSFHSSFNWKVQPDQKHMMIDSSSLSELRSSLGGVEGVEIQLQLNSISAGCSCPLQMLAYWILDCGILSSLCTGVYKE